MGRIEDVLFIHFAHCVQVQKLSRLCQQEVRIENLDVIKLDKTSSFSSSSSSSFSPSPSIFFSLFLSSFEPAAISPLCCYLQRNTYSFIRGARESQPGLLSSTSIQVPLDESLKLQQAVNFKGLARFASICLIP